MIAQLHTVLVNVIFLFLRLQWFLYHTLSCSLYYHCIQYCNGYTTTHCVVHCMVVASKIAMVAPLHIVLFIVFSVFNLAMIATLHIALFIVFFFIWLQWFQYHTLCCSVYHYCFKDCNDCTTAHCVAPCKLSHFEFFYDSNTIHCGAHCTVIASKIAMVVQLHIVLFIVIFLVSGL